MSEYPHPAQLLFDRTVRTWVLPHVRGLQLTEKLHVQRGLILWGPDAAQPPQVLLNEDVAQHVEGFTAVVRPGATVPGPIRVADILGLEGVAMRPQLRQRAFIFFVQGRDSLYFLKYQRLAHLELHGEFQMLEKQLATRGLEISNARRQLPIYLDVTPNLYGGTPAAKRRQTAQEVRFISESGRRLAPQRIRRNRKLPPIITLAIPQVTSLLREARATYVDGHYFSTVAAAATTADRICLFLAERYEAPPSLQRWLRDQTFGGKLEKMRSLGLITANGLASLQRLNRVRNRHLHPKQPVSGLTMQRDALLALRHLHAFVEQSLSVYRDHRHEDGGVLAPKPIT